MLIDHVLFSLFMSMYPGKASRNKEVHYFFQLDLLLIARITKLCIFSVSLMSLIENKFFEH